MFKYFLALVLLLLALPLHAADNSSNFNYSWASKRIESSLWGVARGDVTGDGKKEWILLERKRVSIGDFEGDKFKETLSCEMPGTAMGARVYTIDINDDKKDEIIVSAVEEGLVSSAGFEIKDGKCVTLFDRARWSLRVTQDARRTAVLLGQGWSSQSYFSGPIRELKYEGGKLKEVAKIDTPWNTSLYDFALMSPIEDSPAIAVLKGYNVLEIKVKKTSKFKKEWSSGEKLGGTPNFLSADQRPLLDEMSSNVVGFNIPPVVYGDTVFAIKEELPLKNFIGRSPLIRGAEIIGYKPDPAFFYKQDLRTIKLQGAITDYTIDIEGENGAKKLIVLMQVDPGMFHDSEKSLILMFDL